MGTQVVLEPVRTALAMSAIVATLTVANSVGLWMRFRHQRDTLFGLAPLFDFDREGNLPAFYSACALLLCAGLFGMIAGHAAGVGDRWRRQWAGLGWIFLFLAFDEAAELHELLILPLRAMVRGSSTLFYYWVFGYGVLVVAFGLSYLRFYAALPQRLRLLLGIAGVVYVSAALGLEAAGAAIIAAGGPNDWRYAIASTSEEFLEMAAIVLVVYALLRHIETQRITTSLRAFAATRD